eukprot:SM000007S20980  [mRNA]  locus=s7:1471294:1479028:+ [translate_table: standard]
MQANVVQRPRQQQQPPPGAAALGANAWRTWQTDGDSSLRTAVLQQILSLFQQRRPQQPANRLTDFVKCLEDELYKDASSKEVYADVSTLEHRLQQVAKRMMPSVNRGQVATANGAGGQGMQMLQRAPSPASSSAMGTGAGMMPTPGSNSMPSAVGGFGSNMMGAHPGNMIPTPGGVIGGLLVPQQQLASARMPGGMANGQGFPLTNGTIMNGVGSYGSTNALQQHQQSLQLQARQRQQTQQLRMPGSMGMTAMVQNPSSMAMNAADLGGGLGSTPSLMVPTGPVSEGHQPLSKMIPVPGLAPMQQQQQHDTQPPDQLRHGTTYAAAPSTTTSVQQQQQKLQQQVGSTAMNLLRQQALVKGKDGLANLSASPQTLPASQLLTVTQARADAGAAGPPSTTAPAVAVDPQRAAQYQKQQRWLHFLRHGSKCTAPEGQCTATLHCSMARQLWAHVSACRDPQCTYQRCIATRTLLEHHKGCRDTRCPVCEPVRRAVHQQRASAANNAAQAQQASRTTTTGCGLAGQGPAQPAGPLPGPSQVAAAAMHQQEDMDGMGSPGSAASPPPSKKPKMTSVAASLAGAYVVEQERNAKANAGFATAKPHGEQVPSARVKADVPGVKVEPLSKVDLRAEAGHVKPEVKLEASSSGPTHRLPVKVESVTMNGKVPKQEAKAGRPLAQHVAGAPVALTAASASQRAAAQASSTSALANASAMAPKARKSGAASLMELFTPQMIREHIRGLRQWVGQSKARAEKNQAMEPNENACPLCAMERLSFEPPPIYCTACGSRIKRNAVYYTVDIGESRHYFCGPCYGDIKGDVVEMEGSTYQKARLEKRKNDEETEEGWVECDECKKWQHQICALFNARRNEGGEAAYTCPECCCREMEAGNRQPLPPSAVLGAKDLPKTVLSDHLERRLTVKLEQERKERAARSGHPPEEVPAAEALVVRVVSSVDKKLETKPRFLEIFQEHDYASEFAYKSKVVLLFQRIEGVEVCLFGMYVQEFGADCAQPNHRRVYLSYLDSVKYFRPDVRTVSGDALRTYIYHEILIAYLDFCKLRGFSSCYIWACPPLKGEDYILYCHPEIQKTPKSDKLREWYLSMLRKAANEGIVVETVNLYDTFFVTTGESRARVTAARLPYFDGDYWPGAAEDMILQLQEEGKEDAKKKTLKKGKKQTKAAPKKRGGKSLPEPEELPANASLDLQLMHKLGESILPMKEDFIMVHLHHCCTHCRNFITSGFRYYCAQCPSFNLCRSCYDAEVRRDEKDRHPIAAKEAHPLIMEKVVDAPAETRDQDEIMESEFFDTRQAFLSLCQGNHYQYDTLRRAKHSSMMVLYHLHNPTAPAFVCTCNKCQKDIETGAGWRCDVCPDFDLCNLCYESHKHPHKLVPHPSAQDRNAQNKEARQQRVLQLRKMMELLGHASVCTIRQNCGYPKCSSVKRLFWHGRMCNIRVAGGCTLCKRMWTLLQLHARSCKEPGCRVPRCKDLKDHLKRLTLQMESRRRAAVNEMLRQRAAEAAAERS